jgi:hypothetical protein
MPELPEGSSLNGARDFVAHKARYGIIGRRSRLLRGSRYDYIRSVQGTPVRICARRPPGSPVWYG